ncbi:MAG: type II toxin-antitoxin system RelE/ParE family toxin [Anaerovibrio sp.]|uniref:type II toxin-antitoxin system RelE/ParE family toxin n=1 Tax=Anaerovibrio sp. TaxID=1872532 RepID=UPI0025E59302|nr:type II toxin-antitoxin system RelE/ParE family toxin [Anaerovibrio sp.]MCR5175463.1 type II toxin-antitoxin system RelE/ParE family toxin [Anaerovibrio sp.]
MKYTVNVSPSAKEQLVAKAAELTIMQDEDLGGKFIDEFISSRESLESLPERGAHRLKYLPSMYRLIPFWPHLWLVYRVNKKEKVVYIDLVLDDRSDYGSLFDI